jgi:hypothetical protein
VGFAIGAKRITPLWRTLTGMTETDWVEAIDMPGAQVAVADYSRQRHTDLETIAPQNQPDQDLRKIEVIGHGHVERNPHAQVRH